MRPSRKVIYLGWIKAGSVADDGESMKNQLCISRLEELGVKCYKIDTYHWKKHKLRSLALPWLMLTHPRATLVFSSSAQNIYPLMKILKVTRWPQRLVHWVIGGSLPERIKNGMFNADVINKAEWTLVESPGMARDLIDLGIRNVLEVPNFKPVPVFMRREHDTGKLRFVFVSRIMAEKGCGYILDSIGILNREGLGDRFSVDFFGNVDDSFKDEFFRRIGYLDNACYKGFLDLKTSAGYGELSGYDMMLFPTYWRGEGFAGIFIDAFIAGLPVIASDWSCNKEILKEGSTALFVPVHDPAALASKMKECIEGKYELTRMREACLEEATRYDVRNVVTTGLLKKIGLL